MVCEFGMSEKLGPLSFGQRDEQIFLGREIATHKDFSEQTAVLIDEEVRKVVETAWAAASDIMRTHVDKLHALAESLLENETLDGIVAAQPFWHHGVLLPDLFTAGIPVITEKPLSCSVEAGEAILNAKGVFP